MERKEGLDKILKEMANKTQANVSELWKSAEKLLDYSVKKGEGEYYSKDGYSAYKILITPDVNLVRYSDVWIEIAYLRGNNKAPRMKFYLIGNGYLSLHLRTEEPITLGNTRYIPGNHSRLFYYPVLDVEKTDTEYLINKYTPLTSEDPVVMGVWEDAIIKKAASTLTPEEFEKIIRGLNRDD